MTTPTTETPTETAEERFRAIVQEAAQALDAALAVFLETEDPAGPHKARVALRRLTTALDAFQPLLRRRPSARLRARAKRMFRDLGRVRDSDVHLARARPVPRDLAERNRTLRERTRAQLRKDGMIGFTQGLRGLLLAEDALFRRSSAARERRAAPVALLAAAMLAAAWDRCAAYGPSILSIPDCRRHEFRKDMKSLRYLAEFLEGVFPALARDPWTLAFRDIQDGLGAWNDHVVALAIDGAAPPARLPAAVARALTLADRRWRELAVLPRPWA
jgi:CHAD domain-containing protein